MKTVTRTEVKHVVYNSYAHRGLKESGWKLVEAYGAGESRVAVMEKKTRRRARVAR